MGNIKQQHYIPRCYLKMFANENKIVAYKLDEMKIFYQDISKIAKMNYMYDFSKEISSNIGVGKQYIEQNVLSQNIEPELAKLLKSFNEKCMTYIKNQDKGFYFNPKEKVEISKHIYYMLVRNLYFKNDVLKKIHNIDCEISQQMLLCSDLNSNEFIRKMQNFTWEIIINDTEESFYISDSPIIMNDILEDNDSAIIRNECIVFPCSDKVMILIHNGDFENHVRLVYDIGIIKKLNAIQVKKAFKYVWSKYKSNDVKYWRYDDHKNANVYFNELFDRFKIHCAPMDISVKKIPVEELFQEYIDNYIMANCSKMPKHIMLVSENKTVNASGGIENVICSFANEFINRGYDISMICMDMEEGVPFYPLDSKVNFINLAYQYSDKKLGGYRLFIKKIQKEILRTFCGSKMKFMGKQMKDPKLQYFFDEFTDRLSKCLLEITPDIIITIGPDSARIALDAQRKANIKVVPVIPMNHIDVTRADFSEENLRTFRECNVTQSLIPDFVPTFKKIGIDRVEVIPNIVPQYAEDELVDLNVCHNRIINVGRIDGALKRQHLIIEAFTKIAVKYPKWHVSLYGSIDNKKYKKKLDKMIADKGLQNRVCFEGTTNNIVDELRKSDIFLFPSESEGFGLAMTEAMSIGLPIIASKCNIAANNIVENGKTGIICDDDELANELEKLILDKQLRLMLGKNAHDAMKEYSAKNVWDKWEKLIDETIVGVK